MESARTQDALGAVESQVPESENDTHDEASQTPELEEDIVITQSGRHVVKEYTELHNDEHIAYTVMKGPGLRNKAAIKIAAAARDAHWLVQCMAMYTAAFLTHRYAHTGPKVGGNLAQATVVILACQIAPQLSAPSAMGAYLGISSTDVIPRLEWLAVLCALGCVTWLLVSHFKVLVGFGGRIGITAFLTCHALQLLLAMPLGSVPWVRYGDVNTLWDATITAQKAVASLAGASFSATLAKLLRDTGGALENPITGATVASLLCFLTLSSLPECRAMDDWMNGIGVGSFVGMASTERLPTTNAFTLAGLLAGCSALLLSPFCQGWAGFQGTAAFLGCASTLGLLRLADCRKTIELPSQN